MILRLQRAFAQMVKAGLTANPKQLDPAYFYDDLGSALFDAITFLPEYTITRVETELLRNTASEIIDTVGVPLELIELGPGNGEKLAMFFQNCAYSKIQGIHLIDVSSSALERARERLLKRCEVDVAVYRATFAEGLAKLPAPTCKRLVLLLGSNIGNFSPSEAADFLRLIRGSLVQGDALLLGVDLIKPETKLLAAYDDSLGVTAAFNKNILLRINRELQANFDAAAFDHRAIWNAEASRIEMHLVSLVDQMIDIPGLELSVSFSAGESIWTESSYKYTPDLFRELVERAGFQNLREWRDDEHGFLEALFTV
jgi:L-histidine Nalpha-methyltransferase